MALDAIHKDRIERWTGEVKADTELTFETWTSQFGEPELAALQFLTRRRSTMVLTPTQVGSGSDRVNHSKNLEAIDDLIGDLVGYINANIGDLTLTEDGADLLAAAGSGASEETIVVDTVVSAPRRG